MAWRASRHSDCTVENLHEWRKQTKYLRYELQILRRLWPGPICGLVDEAHKLSDYLGDEHDLGALREKVLENEDAIEGDEAHSALLALIDRRRVELRDRAFVLGRRMYEEKPKAFESRFGKYWKDWKAQRATST